MALIKREEDHDAIDKATVNFHKFDEEGKMMQPRPVSEWQKEAGRSYADWSCAMDIWMILSKYANFYSKE